MSILSDGWTSRPFLYQDTVALGDACTMRKRSKLMIEIPNKKIFHREIENYSMKGMFFYLYRPIRVL